MNNNYTTTDESEGCRSPFSHLVCHCGKANTNYFLKGLPEELWGVLMQPKRKMSTHHAFVSNNGERHCSFSTSHVLRVIPIYTSQWTSL